MDDLIEFLRARLDEDEADVKALTVPHDWHTGPGDDPQWTDEELVCMWPPEFHTPYEQDKHWRGLTVSGPELAAYIARHDPAHALREIEAKRQQIAHYQRVAAHAEDHPDYALAAGACAASLRHAAAVYADHPGYREEWRP